MEQIISFEDWVEFSSETLDFTTWGYMDKLELYFERMDAVLLGVGV